MMNREINWGNIVLVTQNWRGNAERLRLGGLGVRVEVEVEGEG